METPPVIRTTYEIVDPESAAHGDARERGWHDEDGESMEPDNDEESEGMSVVDKAVEWLQDHGAAHASSSHFHSGVWYSAEPEHDWKCDDETTYSFHLAGFTVEQERDIAARLHLCHMEGSNP
jgi:hypothetical protein